MAQRPTGLPDLAHPSLRLDLFRGAESKTLEWVGFSSDGRWFAACSMDGTLVGYEVDTWWERWRTEAGALFDIAVEAHRPCLRLDGHQSICFQTGQRVASDAHSPIFPRSSPTGRWQADHDEERGGLGIYDASGALVVELQPGETVIGVAFCRDDQRLCTSVLDDALYLWQLPSGERIARLTVGGLVGAIALSSDDRTAAIARVVQSPSVGWGVAVVRLSDGSIAAHHEESGFSVTRLAWSPDGRWLALGWNERQGGGYITLHEAAGR